jgi:hypothetical protein
LYREARNILSSGVNQGSEAVDAGPAAAAAGAGHADASAGDDAFPRWFEIQLNRVSPGVFVNELGEQCDEYFRLFV